MAHLGYFRQEFVERRQWMDERSYADLVALCQFLPGPASSQVGLAVGLARGGWRGAVAAWVGFTMPSALLLIGFALMLAHNEQWASSGALHGLKVATVAVVAQAVWGMSRSLCPDRTRAAIAVGSALIALLLPSALAQIGAIVLCGVIGWKTLSLPGQSAVQHISYGVSRTTGMVSLTILVSLLLVPPFVISVVDSSVLTTVDAFFRSGAMVFGGGHVVLPLLQTAVVPNGAVSNAEFLAGYAAAQAVPGPLFTFAAYLGAVMNPDVTGISGWAGGLICLVAIFLPAGLLVVGALPFWDALRQRASVQSALAGVNAGVVGILLAALYDPVWTSAIDNRWDFALALGTFALLIFGRVSPIIVVALAAAIGWLMKLF